MRAGWREMPRRRDFRQSVVAESMRVRWGLAAEEEDDHHDDDDEAEAAAAPVNVFAEGGGEEGGEGGKHIGLLERYSVFGGDEVHICDRPAKQKKPT